MQKALKDPYRCEGGIGTRTRNKNRLESERVNEIIQGLPQVHIDLEGMATAVSAKNNSNQKSTAEATGTTMTPASKEACDYEMENGDKNRRSSAHQSVIDPPMSRKKRMKL